MKNDTKLPQLALAIVMMCASAGGWAQSREPTVWVALDASKPEHGAIIGWHKALVENNYASYLRYAGPHTGTQ